MRRGLGYILCLGVAIAGRADAVAGPPEKVSPDVLTLARANNQFALCLYRHLARERQNLFLSPTSLSAALTMTYAGARGETAEQMGKVLHGGRLGARVHSIFGSFLRDIDDQARRKGDQLEFASALWAQRGEVVQPDFRSILKRDYQSDLYETNFRDPEAARQEVNQWAEKQTRGRISSILPPGSVDSQTRLILTNAIYFKGSWAAPFRKEDTWDSTFHTPEGSKDSIPFMHQTGPFFYWEDDRLQALELPYADGAIVMDFFLPKGESLAALEAGLSADSLDHWLSHLGEQQRRVEIALPRFKVLRTFELKGVLSELGMPAAFSAGADFSGIAPDGRGFSLAALVHKALIEVNEEGTEASAVTAPRFTITSMGPQGPRFRADRPFLFLIRDLRSGSILFMGRLVNPQESSELLGSRD